MTNHEANLVLGQLLEVVERVVDLVAPMRFPDAAHDGHELRAAMLLLSEARTLVEGLVAEVDGKQPM